MQRFLLAFLLLFSVASKANAIKFSEKEDGTIVKTLKMKGQGLEVSLKGTHKALVMTVKNTGSTALEINHENVSIVDVSGRGTRLCFAPVTVKPGKSVTITLVPCFAEAYNEGTFGLRYEYKNKKALNEAKLFLAQKEHTLKIAGESFTFYTQV